VRGNIITVPIEKIDAGETASAQDLVAVEDPLQIRLNDRDTAITMRTPGNDRELAAGFLFTEGILEDPSQIRSITQDDRGTICIQLVPGHSPEAERLARNFYVTSSCGVCGKASIQALEATGCTALPRDRPSVNRALIPQLPETLRSSQAVFERTGGLHAAGLFDLAGALVAVREDVGRHNAVDKLIGWAFLEKKLPLADHILMLSGRISFELVQKALRGGIPIAAAVGAPSSLAIETALRFGVTLIGFLRGNRFNVYSGASRIQ